MVKSAFALRATQLDGHKTLVAAALLAAHATHEARGFLPSDARFFFLLFANWLEHDVLRPEQDLDLTQLRRALDRLAGERWARVHVDGAATRSRRHWLTPKGLVGLAEAVTDPSADRLFEESLFAFTFAASYGPAIVARITRGARPLTPQLRRRLRALLDPARILRSARARLEAVIADLARRADESRQLEAVLHEGKRAQLDDVEIVRRLERASPYQLQRVRTMREVLARLPKDLIAVELGDAFERRRCWIFSPIEARTRAELQQLDRLERERLAKK